MVNELIRNMPVHEKDDDIEVEAKLRFWEDGEPSVLKIEDDAYYGSDFTRMIILLSIIDSDYKCYDEIEQIYVGAQIVDGKVLSEDNIDNCLDDGTTWAEAWLRMNMFEMSVDIRIQQFQSPFRNPSSALLISEDEKIVDGEVQKAGKTHCRKITDDDIPACVSFYKQEHPKPEEEYCRTGKIIRDIEL